ncbi:MAG: NADH-quinone oxidoreductase subunit H [Phycisphaeraceae bacterium]|nr:NADH-quinone oxidoreductase subunit H [Phycisphaeraceae bacterium]
MFSAQVFVSMLVVTIALHVILGAVAYSVMLERKIASWVQNRIGPNRTGFDFGQPFLPKFHFWGLGQPLADGLKLFLKEDYTPPNVDKVLFIIAPMLAVVPALIAWAVIPWGGYWDFPGLTVFGTEIAQPGMAVVTVAPINIGILYFLAVGSLAVYGVVIGGYASNNKYSFLGGLRATAQMLSYEIPLGVSILIIILMFGTARTDLIVLNQAQGILGWNIVWMPLLAVIFFTSQLAEANRTPFDLAECEQELVGGFHTEYSSMKFALYFLAEYAHIVTGAAFFTLLFLGGWSIPFYVGQAAAGGLPLVLLNVGVFAFKMFLIVALVMVIRWTIPRFRFDQLMQLAWRCLIPVSLILLLAAAVLVALKVPAIHWWMLGVNVLTFIGLVVIGPKVPKGPPVNRKIPLEGSRFSPLTTS